MIHSLTLNNFQSHKASTLTFCPGVNVIVGSSDVGKSSVVRALRWVFHNRPAGAEFISHWAKTASVQVVLDNITLARVRNEARNCYVINEQELVGFGQEVPSEIVELTQIDERNIQYQLDSPFLLDESPGFVARTLNRVVSLDKIDESLSQIQKLETDTKTKLTHVQKEIEQRNEEIAKSPDFGWIDTQLTVISNAHTKQTNSQKTASEIVKLIKEIEICTDKLDNICVPDISLSDIELKLEQLQHKEAQYQRLVSLLQHMQKQDAELERLKGEFVTYQNRLKSLCPNLCPLCGHTINPTLFASGGANKQKAVKL